MLCGLRSLKRVDESWSTNASKKKKKADEKNPYSTRGLDKFAAVLADLGDRRAKIMANAGPQDASTSVWFMYSESSECVPILLRHNDHVSPRPMPPAVGHADDEDVKEVIKEMVAVPEKESVGRMLHLDMVVHGARNARRRCCCAFGEWHHEADQLLAVMPPFPPSFAG
ncbi:hypothetical protein OPV22_019012 [Ensete ventricosum]|uniref:Uncharacterized protein n=1 Tax=Ensete ventricosum TaxID=4639 RepID=A0AAV8QVH4_ENSVE|nr:hypothetical protein OPV22_019012 [Ensete ventricosum]